MSKKKLSKAPLKEVIFELFWKMTHGPAGELTDPGYSLAIGGFANDIKSDFPVRKQVMPDGVSIYPHPQYQFWKEEATWPVIQIGPGMLAVNDTDKNYSWENNFKGNIQRAVNALISSYELNPKFEKVRLQYIDAIDLPDLVDEIESVIYEKLQTSISRKYVVPGKLKDLAINQSYKLDDGSVLSLNIRNGRNNLTSKQAIVWTTLVEYKGTFDANFLLSWLEDAHSLASDIFVKVLNPTFYAELDS